MANYKLALDLGKSNYKEVEWNTLKNIDKKESFKLEQLVKFTTEFKNEEMLKNYLLNNDLITINDYKKKLCIIYRSGGNLKKLIYGVSYKNTKLFFNEEFLIKTMLKYSNNIEFLEKLANHYRNSYIQGTNIADLYNYINGKKRGFYDTYDSIPILSVLTDFLYREIYKYDKERKCYIANEKTGEILVNYKNLRDLAMFVANYELSKSKKEEDKLEVEKNFYEEENNSGKWILSSEGDPDFPPNSEEEAMYNRYLEDLNNAAIYPNEDYEKYIR